jgi:hypothetical protein
VVFTGVANSEVSNGIFFRRNPLIDAGERGIKGVPDFGVYLDYFNYDMIFAYGPSSINHQFHNCKKLKRRERD